MYGKRRIRARQQCKKGVHGNVLRLRIHGCGLKGDLIFHGGFQRAAAQNLQFKPGERLALGRLGGFPACKHAKRHAIHHEGRALILRCVRRLRGQIGRRFRFSRACGRGQGEGSGVSCRAMASVMRAGSKGTLRAP